MNTDDRQSTIRRVTWIGACIDALLAFVKMLTGWLVHSPALIADGFHSLSDLLTDAAVVVFSHWAQAAPDDDHPYGHHRYETLGTVILGTSLIVIASAIAWDSARALIYGTYQPAASSWAIMVALISIASKEWIFRYTLKASKKIGSRLLEANAWHSRSDALSSIIVLFGVVATWFGYGWIELYAAIGVAILIGKMGVELTWNASQDLIDRGIEPEEAKVIEKTIRETPGVLDVHMLRSRMMGNNIYLDVHIQVDHMVSVSEGHFISDQVVKKIQRDHDHVSDIIVHVDHEDDFDELTKENVANNADAMPERKFIELQLAEKNIIPARLQLHYSNETVGIELFFKQEPEDLPVIKSTLDAWVNERVWLSYYTIYISA